MPARVGRKPKKHLKYQHKVQQNIYKQLQYKSSEALWCENSQAFKH